MYILKYVAGFIVNIILFIVSAKSVIQLKLRNYSAEAKGQENRLKIFNSLRMLDNHISFPKCLSWNLANHNLCKPGKKGWVDKSFGQRLPGWPNSRFICSKS